MAEVAAAAAAVHLGAWDQEGAVRGGGDRMGQRAKEARPPGAALEFRLRGEQRERAAGAGERSLALLAVERARVRPLGRMLAQHAVLRRLEQAPPLVVALCDLERPGRAALIADHPAHTADDGDAARTQQEH